jgi:RNA polymerase sigma-70 factor (ECF subfamily)
MQETMQLAGTAAAPVDELSDEALVQEYVEPVHRFAALLCRSPAEREDIAQEALIRALRSRHRYDPARGEFAAWLWRITLNVARDRGRAAGRARALWERLADRGSPAEAESAETVALQRLEAADVVAAVHRLPARYRTLIALRFGGMLSYRQMADVLGISEGAATQAVRRALHALRADLEVIDR